MTDIALKAGIREVNESLEKIKPLIPAINLSLEKFKERQDITNEQIERIETITNKLEYQSKISLWITVSSAVVAIIALFISLYNLFY